MILLVHICSHHSSQFIAKEARVYLIIYFFCCFAGATCHATICVYEIGRITDISIKL